MDNLFFLAPQVMGLGGSLCTAEELLPPPGYGWIMVDLPARLPKTCLRLSTLRYTVYFTHPSHPSI